MASIPLIRVLESCSLMTMKGRPYSSKARLIWILKRFKNINRHHTNSLIAPQSSSRKYFWVEFPLQLIDNGESMSI